jgi:hypothetical protein
MNEKHPCLTLDLNPDPVAQKSDVPTTVLPGHMRESVLLAVKILTIQSDNSFSKMYAGRINCFLEKELRFILSGGEYTPVRELKTGGIRKVIFTSQIAFDFGIMIASNL